MGRFGITEILVIGIVLLVLFGRGITAFKEGVKDGSEEIESASASAARDVTPADKDKV